MESFSHKLIDAGEGLRYLHSENLVHCDIKAVRFHCYLRVVSSTHVTYTYQDNIVVDPKGKALLCDFGSSRFWHTSLSIAKMSSAPKGTLTYWAPEVIATSNYSEAADTWAFGMTIYVCLLAMCEVIRFLTIYRR